MIKKAMSIVCPLVCLLICMILIGRVVLHTNIPLHTPHTIVQRASESEPTSKRQITLDSDALNTLLTRQLPENFILENPSIQITAQNQLLCIAQIRPEHLSLPQFAEKLLPDHCQLSIILSLGYTEDEIVLHPTRLEVAGLHLPSSLVTPFMDALSEALMSGLRAQGIQLQSLTIQDQKLLIGLKP